MVNYPSDWLCKCGHLKDQHVTDGKVYGTACSVKTKTHNVFNGYVDNCVTFDPIDNLTFVELLAKAKGRGIK